MCSLLTPLLEKLLAVARPVMKNATDANYRVIKPGWYFSDNHNASGRQCSVDCLWHSLNCL